MTRFRSGVAWAVLLLGTVSVFAQDASTSRPAVAAEVDEPVTFTLAPGGSRTFTIKSPYDGSLSIWCSSKTLDTALRVVDAKGVTHDDDDGGGRPTPHLLIEVVRGDVVAVTARAKTRPVDAGAPGASEPVTLIVRGVVETAETRKAMDVVNEDLAEARELRGEGEMADARAVLREAAASLLAIEGASRSHVVAHAGQVLAVESYALGDLPASRALFEQALAVFSRTLPEDHPDLQLARLNLAMTLGALGDLPAARALAIAFLRGTRSSLQRLQRDSLNSIAGDDVRSSISNALSIDRMLRIEATTQDEAVEQEAIPLEAASLIEEFRASTERRARLQQVLAAARDDAELNRLVQEWRSATAKLAQVSEAGDARGTRHAGIAREAAARALRDGLKKKGSALPEAVFGHAALCAALRPVEAAVSFWRYRQTTPRKDKPHVSTSESRDVAFLFTRNGGPDLIDLGPSAKIDQLITSWRSAMGRPLSRGLEDEDSEDPAARERAISAGLRELVIDPVLAKAGSEEITTLYVTLSSPVAVLPLEALADADGAPLGQRLRIETLASLIVLTRKPEPLDRRPTLLACGGVDYDAEPQGSDDAEEGDDASDEAKLEVAEVDRSPATARAFSPLSKTEDEVERIGIHFRRTFGRKAPREVLVEREASKESFLRLAPSARYVHVASHGYFAPESIPTTASEAILDAKTGLQFQSARDQVRGLAPSLLCGLAFTGANLGPDKADGILTAEELMHMNLSGCEFAVLSACETAVGLERSGLMIGTLRDALHAAGARRAVTSLWQVGDKATMELMTDFYRRLWREKKDVSTALWEAKMHLRSQKDSRGEPKFTVADWSAFIASGVPRR